MAKLITHPTPHTTTMQENTSPKYRGTYLSQPFDAATIYPDCFDKFGGSRIGEIRIADIPSRIKQKHVKIWGGILNMDPLTTPLSNCIKVAQILYLLRPHVNAQPGELQEKADMHHAFVRLTDLWRKFEGVLQAWARIEVGAHADAADGLTLLEEARFMPLLARFTVVLQGYGDTGLFEEIEEFLVTSITLGQRIESWLQTQGVRLQ